MSQEYRSLYAGLVNHPNFLPLSADAKLVFFMAKLQLGASGIGVLYPATVAAQVGSGWDSDRVSNAIKELSANGERAWVKMECNILWIRKGLENEPQFTLSNPKHTSAILKHLATLPKLGIVNEFAAHYELPLPYPELWEPYSHPDRDSDRVPDTGEEEKVDIEDTSVSLFGSGEPNREVPPKPKSDELKARRIRQVFDYWRTKCGHERATLTKDRRAKINARLATYTVEELFLAIDGAAVDPFYQGDNDRGTRYDYPETIFRNDGKVDRLMEIARRTKPKIAQVVVND